MLNPPRLWVIATPLGNSQDLSPRARTILSEVDVILAEDTRNAEKLLVTCGVVHKKLVSFHDHNEKEKQAWVVERLEQGANVALISDAGTPLVADPGYRLVRYCREHDLPVSPVPGPSAPVCALSASGIAPIPYTFLGFLPRDTGGKRKLFSAFAHVQTTLIFFERADRVQESLTLAYSLLGNRELAVCRELTKTYEEFLLMSLEDVSSLEHLLGEITVVIGPPGHAERTEESVLVQLIQEEYAHKTSRQNILQILQSMSQGWTKKELYTLLIHTKDELE